MSDSKPNSSLMRKSAARMLAVQCLFGERFSDDKTGDELIIERGQIDDDEINVIDHDPKLLRGIVTGAIQQQSQIDEKLANTLGERWQTERMDKLMRTIFRTALYELMYHPKLKSGIIVNEYVTLAASYYDDTEVNFINGALREVAEQVRE